NGGAAWRAPNLFELFANGPHLAEGRYEIGDPNLKAEHALNVDASIRWQSPRVRAELDGFRDLVNDFVYITPTTQTIDGLRVFRHLQADALLTGAEASAEVEAAHNLLLRARHDFVRGTLRDNDASLPLMPPPRTAAGAEYDFSTVWASRAFVGGEVEHVDRQKHPNGLDLVTPGYTLLNLDVGFHYTLFGRSARIDVGVRNATNKSYRNFLSRYKEFALEPGRNLILRISTD
ncbi:MAG: TonB-dependent receptor, partial [Gemmatimonadales bacterium]